MSSPARFVVVAICKDRDGTQSHKLSRLRDGGMLSKKARWCKKVGPAGLWEIVVSTDIGYVPTGVCIKSPLMTEVTQ